MLSPGTEGIQSLSEEVLFVSLSIGLQAIDYRFPLIGSECICHDHPLSVVFPKDECVVQVHQIIAEDPIKCLVLYLLLSVVKKHGSHISLNNALEAAKEIGGLLHLI